MLGLLTAVIAHQAKNHVKLFPAADGVHVLNRRKNGQIVNDRSSYLKAQLDILVSADVEIMVSSVSAKAHGHD